MPRHGSDRDWLLERAEGLRRQLLVASGHTPARIRQAVAIAAKARAESKIVRERARLIREEGRRISRPPPISVA